MAKAWNAPDYMYFLMVSFQMNAKFDGSYVDEGAIEGQIQIHCINAESIVWPSVRYFITAKIAN